MTKETGTLAELNLKVGDVVRCIDDFTSYSSGIYTVNNASKAVRDTGGYFMCDDDIHKFCVISRANPRTWAELTDGEKGALLLAKYEGKTIEYSNYDSFGWCEVNWDIAKAWYGKTSYRIKPEPLRETKELTSAISFGGYTLAKSRYKITLDFIDGVPQPDTIKLVNK